MHNQFSFKRLSLGLVAVLAIAALSTFALSSKSTVSAREPDAAILFDESAAALIYAPPADTPQTVVAAPNACNGLSGDPGAPYTSTIDRTNFCVFYNPATFTLAEATNAADIVENKYWPTLTAELGKGPKFSTKLVVHLTDDSSCNGATGWSSNKFTTYEGCLTPDTLFQKVLGHEMTHRVQYNHDDGPGAPHQTKTFKEGTARAIEDLFAPQDTWVGALAVSSYASQAQTALANPNTDWWAYGWRYNFAIAWKYFSEQWPGASTTEPGYGWNYYRKLFEATTNNVGKAAVNAAHADPFIGGPTYYEAWKKFARALYTKDLNVASLPSTEYYFRDEQQAGDQPGPVAVNTGGPISNGSPATWNGESISKDGMDYYEVSIDGANCPVHTVSFSNATGNPYYWIVSKNGDDYLTDVGGSGTDWSQSFVTTNQTHVTAIVVGLDQNVTVDIEASCANPVIDIKLPNQNAPDYVQPLDSLVVQVLVTDGSPTSPVVGGLSYTDFTAEIDGTPALVLGGGFVQEQYYLLVQAPNISNGPKDLEITLNGPASASDTETEAVIYDLSNTDHVIVLDGSGSMGWGTPQPIAAARAAAHFFIDSMNSSEGLGAAAYNHDILPGSESVAFANATKRSDVEGFIDGITPGGGTSIGDGLAEAVTLDAASVTGNSRCQFILLSDGMENSDQMWADVEASVVGTGCPVMAIAFGPASDETLMQDIATATGGISFYNDVFVSSARSAEAANAMTVDDMELDLGRTYMAAQNEGEGREEYLAEKGIIPLDPVVEQVHTVMIDPTTTEALFSLDWYEPPTVIIIDDAPQATQAPQAVEMLFRLQKPNGEIIEPKLTPYTFQDFDLGHLGYRIENPDPGEWKLLVTHQGGAQGPQPYQVLVSGDSQIQLALLLPAVQAAREAPRTGQNMQIIALAPANQPGSQRISASPWMTDVVTYVTAPDGTEKTVKLYDDGEHDDGDAGDGLYSGYYTLINQATENPVEGEDGFPTPAPKDQGAYRVVLKAFGQGIQREVLGSFAVEEGEDVNNDGIPDIYTDVYGPANADPDLDTLKTEDEYFNGTDPHHSDSDTEGILQESDWSEVQNGSDPLDPSDDAILAPESCFVLGTNGANELIYDVKPEYDLMRAYRRTNDGPWNLHIAMLPIDTSGLYTDTTDVVNGESYEYQIHAVDGNHTSAQVPCGIATPAENWIAPAALLRLDDGVSTPDLEVELTFFAYEDEEGLAEFAAIDEMRISNDSNDFSAPKSQWQPFQQSGFKWMLDGSTAPGEIVKVYVEFRNVDDLPSVAPAIGTIRFGSNVHGPNKAYIPLVIK